MLSSTMNQLQLGDHTKHFEVSIMVNRGDITITKDPINDSIEFNKNVRVLEMG